MIPEGVITSVKLETRVIVPQTSKTYESRVLTRIHSWYEDIETIDKRIRYALNVQRLVREFLAKRGKDIREYLGVTLPVVSSRTILNLDGETIPLLYSPPHIKLIHRLGVYAVSDNLFEAFSTLDNLSSILPALDYQIEKFGKIAR